MKMNHGIQGLPTMIGSLVIEKRWAANFCYSRASAAMKIDITTREDVYAKRRDPTAGLIDNTRYITTF